MSPRSRSSPSRSSSCRRASSAGRKSRRCEMTAATSGREARIDVAGAVKDAALAGLLAFGLFLPLIGFKTVPNMRNELELETRFPLLLAFVAIVAGGRLLYALVV